MRSGASKGWGLLLVCVAGCGGQNASAPGPQSSAGGGAAQADAPVPAAQAVAKFNDFSRDLEKLGTDELVDADALKKQLEAIVAIDRQYVPARFNLAVLEARKGDAAAAKAELEKIAEQDPNFAPARENLAADLVRAGRIDEALPIYQAIVEKNPKNQTSRLALARIYAAQGRYEDAIELCRQVLQRQADAIEAFRILAKSYDAVGNTPMAELIIGRGLKISKDDVELHYQTARILLARDDLPNGVAKLKHVVRLDPKRLGVRAELADIALSYRDFGNAAQQYEAILKEKADVSAVQNNLAVSYKGLGRYEQAEKLYKELLTKDENNAAALWNASVLYHRHLNKFDDAMAMLRRFKQAAPQGDEKVAQVDGLIAEIDKLKSDQAATAAREEHERKKREAIENACQAVAAGKPADGGAIGNDQERIEVAWQLMGAAQQSIEGGDVAGGEGAVKCAFGILPDSPAAASSACAPMRVMWTQILYQLGRLDDAVASIAAALKCDPNNPDAQLIAQQLAEIQQQQQQQQQQQPQQQEGGAPAAAPAP